MSKQEVFHQPEKPLEKTWEIDNKTRISEETEIKKKIQKKSEGHISVRHPVNLSNIVGPRKYRVV